MSPIYWAWEKLWKLPMPVLKYWFFDPTFNLWPKVVFFDIIFLYTIGRNFGKKISRNRGTIHNFSVQCLIKKTLSKIFIFGRQFPWNIFPCYKNRNCLPKILILDKVFVIKHLSVGKCMTCVESCGWKISGCHFFLTPHRAIYICAKT